MLVGISPTAIDCYRRYIVLSALVVSYLLCWQYEQLTQNKSAFETKMQRQHDISEVRCSLHQTHTWRSRFLTSKVHQCCPWPRQWVVLFAAHLVHVSGVETCTDYSQHNWWCRVWIWLDVLSPFWGLKTPQKVFLSVILWTCVVLQSCSLSALQARLKVAAHQAEEESEETAESFLEGKTDIDDFLANFMEKRTVNWTNCQKVKSTSWHEVVKDWYQHTAEFYLRCIFQHFNTSLLSKQHSIVWGWICLCFTSHWTSRVRRIIT